MPSVGVAVSASVVNTSVTFAAQGGMFASFQILINSDNVALEKNEQFEIGFLSSSPSNGVLFGPTTEVSITDNDGMY